LATVQHSMLALPPGVPLNAEAGSYAGFIVGWDPPNSGQYSVIAGTATAPITIQADPAAAPGSVNITGRNTFTAYAIDLEPGCDYLTIKGFTITNPTGVLTKGGILATGNNDQILNNTVSGVNGFGIVTNNAMNI